jgi:hypothetical protein
MHRNGCVLPRSQHFSIRPGMIFMMRILNFSNRTGMTENWEESTYTGHRWVKLCMKFSEMRVGRNWMKLLVRQLHIKNTIPVNLTWNGDRPLPSPTIRFKKDEMDPFREWLKLNGFDWDNPKLALGYIKLGQVDLEECFGADNFINCT